ncbi:MAG: tetratricopeptide repeat protein [Cytophagales bacterium]|jgi:signal transduction histidine kinase|nr:tetratricopeptide repeat protein [Cytophagales bacterium]MCA6388143.1 tetratricopeptide repeat protein [Cytophagales bacterium]MCA6391912.1 tetratricopeptide repeat protein [Cytophagales bacterium]MCA6395372.1 tetratricopeptide repeat protein [Cytophagales bacterium]MCA6400016.1 tetratricopeptide repeat protein [Cytophagales bacterium]
MVFKWKIVYIATFVNLITLCVFGQDQKLADSLVKVYREEKLTDSTKLELLWNLSFNEVSDLDLSLKYSEELIRLSQQNGDNIYLYRGYLLRGNNKKLLGDLDGALNDYYSAADVATKGGYAARLGTTYSAIASVYRATNNHSNTMLYYYKAIAVLKQGDNTLSLATTLLNAGEALRKHKEYDSALLYFKESATLFEKANSLTGKAYNLGNVGMVYASLGKNELAERNLNEAIQLLEGLKDYYPICSYFISMADIYLEKGDLTIALNYAGRSLKLAQQHGLKEQASEASLKLSQLHEQAGNTEQSLKYYKDHIAYRDNVNNLEVVQKIADQRTQFEVSLKEKEIDLLQQEKIIHRVYILVAFILLLLAVVVLLYFRQRFIHTRLMADHQRKLNDERIENLLKEQEVRAMQSLVVGREEERKRIAHDLHNHLGSLLATIKVNLNGIPERNMPNFKTIASLVDQACSDVRGMSHSLNMGISEDFGLIPALKDLVAHLGQSGDLEVEFNASVAECQLDSVSEIAIYRIVQELVSNVLKHAHATKLSILLTCFAEDNLVNILVHDNGKGFDLPENGEPSIDGMGLHSIRQMVKQQQGEINFDSNPASGTTVNIDLPISNSVSLL